MKRTCHYCRFLVKKETNYDIYICDNYHTPFFHEFIKDHKNFGCVHFKPNEKYEICEFCDGEGLEYVDKDSWMLCHHCNGIGFYEKKD